MQVLTPPQIYAFLLPSFANCQARHYPAMQNTVSL